MKVEEAEAIVMTFIKDDLDTLYDKIERMNYTGISPGMMLSAMCIGVIARREGDGALGKIIQALQQMESDGKGSDRSGARPPSIVL